MSRLFVYITLSLVLHFLAVLPLLAEQLPSAAKVTEVQIERTSVSVPRLVVNTVSTGLLNQASEQPLAAPVVVQPELKPESEAQKTQGQALAKLKTEIKKIVAQRPYAAVAQPKVLPAKAPESESEKTEQSQASIQQPHVAAGQPKALSAHGSESADEKVEIFQEFTSNRQDQASAQKKRAEIISKEPRFASAPSAPVYPAHARRRQQQGTVWVDVHLDARGQQLGLQVLRSSGVKSLDQAALAAVKKWQFLPELQSGVAVPSRVHIPIEFAIAAKPSA